MSLNGLDAAAVVEAHQATFADAGGWFLLKYITRDTVDLLSRGAGGVADAKQAVERYEEKSPLYGLVQYRRKRVMLKYVPDGTSRLLQVRLSVQFQSVLEAFPQDAVFSFTSPSELSESALGLCTLMQPPTAGTLTPSSSSMRGRRLNEISEDAEESSPPVPQKEEMVPQPQQIRSATVDVVSHDTLPASALKAKALLAQRKKETSSMLSTESTSSSIQPVSLAARPITSPITSPTLTTDKLDLAFADVPQYSTPDDTKSRYSEQAPPQSTADTNLSESIDNNPRHFRHLSVTESETIKQWNNSVTDYPPVIPSPKPKKKLAPRPHVEAQVRPKTSGTFDDSTATRPVANLPNSIRMSTRQATNPYYRPGSQQSSRSVPARFVPTSTVVPPVPVTPNLAPAFKTPERRTVPSAVSSAATDHSNVAPEKLRLMKALQMRKRNQLLSSRAASVQSTRTAYTSDDDFPLGRPIINTPEATVLETVVKQPTIVDAIPETVEGQGIQDSCTASPSSVHTTSEHPSTKPSSYLGDTDADRKSSQRSISLDTNSSSTPKAGPNSARLLTIKPPGDTTFYVSDSEDEPEPKKSTTPEISPIEEAFMRLTGVTVSPVSEIEVVENVSAQDESEHKEHARYLGLALSRSLPSNNSSGSGSGSASQRPRAQRPHVRMPFDLDSSEVSESDSLMEELHNAVVEEAKPVHVARTPLTPTMRTVSSDRFRRSSQVTPTESHRSVKSITSESNQSYSGSQRSPATALPLWVPSNMQEFTATPLTKKPTLGSSISKRIKALEVISNRESVILTSAPPKDTSVARNKFTDVMKRSSFISKLQVPNASTEMLPTKPLPETPKTVPTLETDNRAPSPWIQPTGSVETYPQPQSGETISVMARIVRDPQKRQGPAVAQGLSDPAINMYRSPLVIEHETSDSRMSRNYSMPSLEAPPLSPVSDKRRFSFSSHRSGSTMKAYHPESMASKLSLAGGKDKRSSKAGSETSSIYDEKKSSRTIRLMKRVSGLGSRFSNKNQRMSPTRTPKPDTITEQREPARGGSTSESMMQVVDIGDVNVQFPETLFWKRRFMRIDDQGYLIFSPPTEYSHSRTSSRKFHLGELRTPALPDVEREEMAWSVILDLKDGTCIQCACESKYAQRQVLKMLLEAHRAYNTLYTG